MANLENISADYLRQILAEVDDGDATKRLMAAITFKEILTFDTHVRSIRHETPLNFASLGRDRISLIV